MSIPNTEISHNKFSNYLPDDEKNSFNEFTQSMPGGEKSDPSSTPQLTQRANSKSTVENNDSLPNIDDISTQNEHSPPVLKSRSNKNPDETKITTATVTTTTNTTATTVTSTITTTDTTPINIQKKHLPLKNSSISSILQRGAMTPEAAVTEAIKQESVEALEILFNNHPELLNTVLREQNQTPLTFSIELKNKKITGYLLTCKNINIHHPGTDGTTALHTASAIGDLASLSILLAAGADPNTIDNQGFTPLISAAAFGQDSVVQALLDRLGQSSKINRQDRRGYTALTYAAVANNAAIARLLLKYGANPKLLTHENKSPMIYAIERGHPEIIQVLMAFGVKADITTASGLTPMTCSVINGHVELTETLLKLRIKFPKNQGEPVAIAADLGYATIVHCLHQHGYPIDEAAQWGRTPLMKACIQGNTETVNLLIALGANLDRIDTDDKTALDLAVAICSSKALREESHFEVIATLLAHMKAPIKINEKTLKPLTELAIGRVNDHQDWGLLREMMAKGLANSAGERLAIDLQNLKPPSAPQGNSLAQ